MSRCLVTGHGVMGIDLKEANDILQELKPDADGKYLDINFSPTKNYIGAMEGL